MRASAPLVVVGAALLAALVAVGSLRAQSAPEAEQREADVTALLQQSEALAHGLSATVGTAISPLLGIAAISAAGYYGAPSETRDALPWYNQPAFWGWALLLLALVAVKDTVGSAAPILKKPLDALELVENQVSALVALPIILPTVVALLAEASTFAPLVEPFVAAGFVGLAADPFGALLGLAAADPFGALLGLAADPFGALLGEHGVVGWLVVSLVVIPVFGVVWFTGHVANVLVLLNPIPFVDTLIKGTRLAVVAVVAATPFISPVLGIVVSLAVAVLACRLFGWSFRLSHLGTVMAWDLLTGRECDVEREAPSELAGFTTAAWRGVPPRSYGHVRRLADGRIELRSRRFLVCPERRLVGPRAGAVGTGLVGPTLVEAAGATPVTWFRFLPRCRGQERAVGARLGIGVVGAATGERASAWRHARSSWHAERMANR